MKTKLLAAMAAALSAGAIQTSAAANNEYFVVVPLPARATAAAEGINVHLRGAQLPAGLVGLPYVGYNLSNLLTITGDSGFSGYGVHWRLKEGALPSGLTLNSDGSISGTPTANGVSDFTVSVEYKTKSGEVAYQLYVGRIVINLDASAPPQAVVGQHYSYSLAPLLHVDGDSTYDGSGVSWSVVSSTLPTGLALRTDGTISGTPVVGGSGTVVARATYRGTNGEQSYSVVTLDIGVSLAAGSPPQALVGQAYSYNLMPHLSVTGDNAYTSGQVSWSVVSSSLAPGLVLNTNGTISGTPTAGGAGTITARATYRGVNGQQTYQIVTLDINVGLATATLPQAIVGQAFNYDLKPLLNVVGDSAFNASNVTWTVVSSSLPSGIVLRTDGVIAGIPTGAGSGTLVARATYRGFNGEQTYQLVTLGINVVLSSGALPQAIVGQAYSYDLKPLLSVTGDGAYDVSKVSWSVVSSSLPTGLTLLTNGVISGTPVAGGTGTLVARATYRGVNGQLSYQVVSLAINVNLAAGTPPAARVGESYSYDLKPNLNVTGDPSYSGSGVSWLAVSNGLPTGLYLTNAGVITGIPTTATTGSLVARATYRAVSGEQSYSISAAPAWTYAWTPGAWATPSACGATTATRSITCVRDDSLTVADNYCVTAKPATTQAATDYSTCTYSWAAAGWVTHSACGTTTATRSVTCLRSDGTTVDDSSCTAVKPTTSQSATDFTNCTYTWQTGSWATPAACGSTTATRSVACVRSDGTTVADSYCGAQKPATTSDTTNYQSCDYSYSYSAYSACSASCGGGAQTRTATCLRSDGATVSNSYCGGTPITTQSCNTQSCYTYSWAADNWVTPYGCGAVTQTRNVTCQRSDGVTVADSNCTGSKPVAVQSGYSTAACDYSYSYGAWSNPAGCGSVTQTRSATCVRSDGVTVSNAYCGTSVTTQAATDYSACSYTTTLGNWTACSATCGGGAQLRSVTCTRTDGAKVDISYCGSPATSQSCNTQACAKHWSGSTYVTSICISYTNEILPLSGTCTAGSTRTVVLAGGSCGGGNTTYDYYYQTCI